MEGNPRPHELSESGRQYFDYLAEMGVAKHFGSLDATLELVELCHTGPGRYVLDVGCGVDVTPCYLAKRFGCRVVGGDITPKMIERCEERAEREGLGDWVEVRAADARALPFEDGEFDAVICGRSSNSSRRSSVPSTNWCASPILAGTLAWRRRPCSSHRRPLGLWTISPGWLALSVGC